MRTIYFALILCLYLPLAVLANGDNGSKYSPFPELEMEFTILDKTILQDGVLVGYLDLINRGNEDLSVMSMLNPMVGTLQYKIIRPGGREKTIAYPERTWFSTQQDIRLKPGEQVRYSVCLLTFDMAYIFDEPGSYEVSVEFFGYVVYGDYRGSVQSVSNLEKLEVQKPGEGHTAYVASHNIAYDIIRAFSDYLWFEDIWSNLDSFGEYEEEQAKLMIFQYGVKDIFRSLFKDGDRKEEFLQKAQAGVRMSQNYEIGIEVRQWLLDAYEGRVSPPEKNGRYNMAGGHYF